MRHVLSSCLLVVSACTATIGERPEITGEGEGETEPDGCGLCPSGAPYCMDAAECVAECPGDRAACSPADGGVCCPGGEVCCASSAMGYSDGDRCSSGGTCPTACENGGACTAGQFCQFDPTIGTDRCLDACGPTDGAMCGGNTCCPLGAQCLPKVGCPLPDLVFDEATTTGSLSIGEQSFAADSCEVTTKGCVGGAGERRLLSFSLMTVNLGPGDLFLPSDDPPLFEYSECHGHSHFVSFAGYRLLDHNGVEVAPGKKMSFCILDMQRYLPDAPAEPRGEEFQCRHLTAGWADIYSTGLSCQWVDITGIEPGDYTLEVTANPERLLVEASYDNNVLQVPVTIGPQVDAETQ